MSTSDKRNDDLRQELLEFYFDCHPRPEEIRRRLDTEPELAALFEEIKSTGSVLEQAAVADAPQLDLTPPVPGAGPDSYKGSTAKLRQRFFRGPWTYRRAWAAAAALVTIGLLPSLGIFAYRAWELDDFRTGNVRLLVSAPAAVPDGSPLTFHVETLNLKHQVMATNVAWKVLDDQGEVLSESTTMCDGSRDITIAGSLNKPRRLVVTATQLDTGFSQTITQAVHPTKAAPLVHLTSDKPAYRPGELVHLRVACLDRLTLRGAQHIGLRCRILDPKGAVAHQAVLGVGKGVTAQVWTIPQQAAGGQYSFEVRDHKNEFTLDHIKFLVRNFQTPTMRKKVTLDRQTYTVGERGKALVAVDRLGGGKAAGAKVRASLVVDGEEVWYEDAILDFEGETNFDFQVPASVLRGAARFVARVTDGGRVETVLEPFVIPTDKVEVKLYPEGGDLVVGVENRVYAQVRDALERPVSGTGKIVDDRGAVVAKFRTQHMGRTRFAFTPQTGRTYQLKLTDPIEKSFDLPKAVATGVVLQTTGDFIPAGKPAALQIIATGQGPWIAAAFCRGVMVGQKSILDPGKHRIEIPVVDTASGVLRITVFDHQMRPVAERLVQREAERKLNITLTPASLRSTPGSKQKVTVRTTDETGEPVSCVIGLTVHDKAVADMLDFVRTGLLDQQQLWTDVDKPDDKLEEFLNTAEHQHRNVDLLLGSLGWRRYVWKDKPDKAKLAALGAAGGDWAKALPVREGRSWAPIVTDTMGGYREDLNRLMWSRREAREWFMGFVAWSCVILGLLLFLHFLALNARWFNIRPRTIYLRTAGTMVAIVFLFAVVLQTTLSEKLGVRSRMAFLGIDTATEFPPTAEMPVAERGFFYDDGGDGDFRGRSENYFLVGGSGGGGGSFVTQDDPFSYVQDFDVEVAQAAGILDGLDATTWQRFRGFTRNGDTGRDTAGFGRWDYGLATQWAWDTRAVGGRINPSVMLPSTVMGNDIRKIANLQDALKKVDGFFMDTGIVPPPRNWPLLTYFRQPAIDGEIQKLENNVATISLDQGRERIRTGQMFALFNATDGYKGNAYVRKITENGRNAVLHYQAFNGKPLVLGDFAASNFAAYTATALAPKKRAYIFNQIQNQAWTQIVFRYTHTASETRSNFAETLFWQPFLLTDDKGEATVEFDVSDSVSTWTVHADAHGHGRVGQATTTFESYMPFRMEAKVLTQVSEGDTLQIPIALIADDKSTAKASARVVVSGPVTLLGSPSSTVVLRDGRGRVDAKITIGRVGSAGAQASIAMLGQVGKAKDSVRRSFRVVPRGFPRRVSQAARIEGKLEFGLPFPKDELAKRTALLKLRFYPSPLADLEQALQGMLRTPSGCFEQVSSTNYPNIMVLSMLKAGGDNLPAVAANAQKMLAVGYKKLTGYEVAGGGFEWWGKQPAHAALTAYGLLQFTDMAQVFEVDEKMVARTRTWLLGKRDGDGGFVTGGGRYGHFQGGSVESRSSYITYALLYSGQEPSSMKVEIDHLAARASSTDNPYELAVAACALTNLEHAAAGSARARLSKMQEPNGSVMGKSSITNSGKRDLRIETTAFAVLSWLAGADEGDNEEAQRAIDFLIKSRQGGGHFGGTQATVMALKALTAYANSSVQALKPGHIHVKLNGKRIRSLQLVGTEKRPIEMDLTEALVESADGERKFEIELTGGNAFPYSLDLSYRADLPSSHPDCALGLETFLSTSTVAEGNTNALHAVVRNKTDKPVANPLVIIGLPAGLHVGANILDDLKKAGRIAAWELRDQEIALYLRGLDAEEQRDITIDVTGHIPGTTKGPASRAFLYYTPDQVVWNQPIRARVLRGR